jgi:hypothetical protein
LAEIAGVRREHDLAVVEPLPGVCPLRRQAHHRAVAEHVVLAIDQAQFVAEVEIPWVEVAPHGAVGVHAGIPLAALHLHCRVGDQRVAADMVEMKMRVDDEVDLTGIAVDRFNPRADLLARLKADPEQPGEPSAEPPGGVVLAIGVQPGVDQRPAPSEARPGRPGSAP